MTTKRLFFTALLLALHTFVRANPENPHAPNKEITGSVAAIENVDNYTYVQIAAPGATNWYAVPSHAFTIGEEVIVPRGGLPMKDFHSETLDRTFDMVYFVGAIKQVNASAQAALPAGHPPINGVNAPAQASLPAGHPPINGVVTAPAQGESDLSGIERPEGGTTVAEIYEQKDALAGKSVVVRGRAVKVANGILGKNWVHLRDGSGKEGSNDLTLTTTDAITVGDTITVSGTLLLDQDFGSGYRYDVLLEVTEILDR